jgi:hypothetical protein
MFGDSLKGDCGRIVQKWNEWIFEQFGKFISSSLAAAHLRTEEQPDSDTESGAPRKTVNKQDKSITRVLELDGDNYPILPNTTGLKLPALRDIARTFITMCYREYLPLLIPRHNGTQPNWPGLYTNDHNVTVPWQAIGADTDKYIKPGCFPESESFVEPSRWRLANLQALFRHWDRLVQAGEMPFEFQSCPAGHKQAKLAFTKAKKRPYVDPDDSSDDSAAHKEGKAKGKGKGKGTTPEDEDAANTDS